MKIIAAWQALHCFISAQTVDNAVSCTLLKEYSRQVTDTNAVRRLDRRHNTCRIEDRLERLHQAIQQALVLVGIWRVQQTG
jgi:hypothetical protein